jgi:hypothetical protein
MSHAKHESIGQLYPVVIPRLPVVKDQVFFWKIQHETHAFREILIAALA